MNPLSALYGAGINVRNRLYDRGTFRARRLQAPVVSVGSISAGGAGKTPFVILLGELLMQRGVAFNVLSRGYERKTKGVLLVDPAGTPQEFGDEPLLIARRSGVPVFVAPQRYDAGLLAESHPVQAAPAPPKVAQAELATPQVVVHILDDGFQHRQLHRDIDILLLNRADWHDRLLPSGNLREPLQAAMRASVIAIPATEPELETDLRARGWQGPVWRLHRRMEIPSLNGPVFAFCGIARSQQFFAGLAAAGLDLTGQRAFPDHHRYTAKDLDRLAGRATAVGATTILTTEKDEVRLMGL
ncbi:MAG TPA: tetraacyldisaccharide 4'-kinase, partial [Steroidobacteraceae bacterium]